MSYTTLLFFLFVSISVLAYFLFPNKKYQWTVLLAASMFFYMYAGYKYIFYILFTSFSIWFYAIAIEHVNTASKRVLEENKKEWDRRQKKEHKKKTKKKTSELLFIALAANFAILFFLKYYDFTASFFGRLTGLSGSLPHFGLVLPLGISFYTFQAAGYIIDVARGNIKAERNFLKFLLFISFFPQIVQGPIASFEKLQYQLISPHRPEYLHIKQGLILVLWGYLKKMVIADRAVTIIQTFSGDSGSYGGTAILFTLLVYALQLYADFSGGIDISRGIAGIMGIEMAENFKRPYFARSINEYWRRWHISLGAWMKKYIFYPLAVSKTFLKAGKRILKSPLGKTEAGKHLAKVFPASVASLIVFLFVGIWHGANDKYIAFGIWNGLIVMISIIFQPLFESWTRALKINTESFFWRSFQMLRTFILVLIGYAFDIGPDFKGSMLMLWKCIADQDFVRGFSQVKLLGLEKYDYLVLLLGTLLIFAVSLKQERSGGKSIGELIGMRRPGIQWLILFFMAVVVISLGVYGPDYDASAFVYMQF